MSTINGNDPNTDDATATSSATDQTDDQSNDTSSDNSQTDDGSQNSSTSDDNSSEPNGSSGSSNSGDDLTNQSDDGTSGTNSSGDPSSQADDGSSGNSNDDNSADQSDDNPSDSSGNDTSSGTDDGSSDSSSDDSTGQPDNNVSDNNNDDSSDQANGNSSDNIVAQNDPNSGQSSTTSGQSGTSSGQSGSQQSGASSNITQWLNDDYPVRMLKVSEALQIVNYLITQSSPALQIDGNKVDQTNMTTMFTGNGVTQKIVKAYRIKPDVINGIQFKYLASQTNPQIIGFVDNVDPRMIVFLYKFTKWLRDTWGPANSVTVTAVHHIGIGHGNAAHLFDCHNTGRAMDLGGIAGTKSDGTAFTLSIYNDWGQKPAINTNGKACFRLAQSNGLIYNFAHDFDAYAMNQCQDKSQGQDPALSTADLQQRMFVTGQPTVNSFIIHPDYPDATLRQAHQDHFHVQIGPTNYESAPPL